jgi:hypothetical protein
MIYDPAARTLIIANNDSISILQQNTHRQFRLCRDTRYFSDGYVLVIGDWRHMAVSNGIRIEYVWAHKGNQLELIALFGITFFCFKQKIMTTYIVL